MQTIPPWLQALMGFASFCVIVITITLIVALSLGVGFVSGTYDEVERQLEIASDSLATIEESVETALVPTNEAIGDLDRSLGGELREMSERIEDFEVRLSEIRDLLNEINRRDAAAVGEPWRDRYR